MAHAGYVNDETIVDADELLRRIHPNWVVPDQKAQGGYRLSTAAFVDSNDGTPCSVSVRRVANLDDLVARFPDRSFATITTGFTRQHGQGVCFWPDDNEPGHAYLFGGKPKTVLRALAGEARYLAGPHSWGIGAAPAPAL